MVDPIHLCPKCMVIRTPRSRHCSTCNYCVERYDHHCPWVNNCIGQKNHGYFMVFLTSLFLAVLSIFTFTIIGGITWWPESEVISLEDLNYVVLPLWIH